ncbi:MAG TPA: serine/threonine-protein kinase [Luteimonas sp.]|nr:serine/threonine-protein kinase [Luteimonas sp.]
MNAQADRQAGASKPDIPGYRLSRVIGEGGMSTVWLGTQLSLGREVAIKVMRPEALADEVSRRRFESEARTIARLEHPHIVGIYEVGRTDDGLPWYAMPYLPRGHVGQRDLRGDPQRVREILRALLSALAFAHARGVVHRDVKAENVLFDEADRPLLADFGIALRRGHGTRVTMTGLAVGSTAYMAPEQARGHQVDHRADLYSVGVLAWEMLAGELPYKADDALAMAIQHAQNPIPKLPPELRQWRRFMDRALAKSPRKRYDDAQQMQQALDDVPLSGATRGLRFGQLAMRAADGLRRLPVAGWAAVALLAAAALGMALHDRAPQDIAQAGHNAPQAPATATPQAPLPADAQAMHGAAPLSAADQLLERMRAQLAATAWSTRGGANRSIRSWQAPRPVCWPP